MSAEEMKARAQYDLIASEINRVKSDNAWRRAQAIMQGTAIILIGWGIIGLGVAIFNL